MASETTGLARVLDHNLAREVAIVLDNWIYAAPLVAALLAVGFGLGRGLGLPNIFRDDAQIFAPHRAWRQPLADPAPARAGWLRELGRAGASPALWSGFGFLAAFGLFWIAIHTGSAENCRHKGAPAFCPTTLYNPTAAPLAHWWLMLALLSAAIVFLSLTWGELGRTHADFTQRSRAETRDEMLRAFVGCLFGMAFVVAADMIGQRLPPEHALWGVTLPYLVLLFIVLTRRSVLPCLSLFSLIMGLILIGTLFPESWQVWTEACVIIAVAAIAAINGRWGRYRLPGFEALYDVPLNPQAKAEPPPGATLVRPSAALIGWCQHRAEHPVEGAPEKPILVVLATSGGAYRAGFWTGLVMDQLVKGSSGGGDWRWRWEGLAGDLRLITGASGGMVAGAYVAMAADGTLGEGVAQRMNDDTRARMAARDGDHRRHPIARDSLSPVVHRLASRDLLQLVTPCRPTGDRGRVLDRQWTTLERPFASFRASEAAGIAPSIILSPMLVETGALALFSNLDLAAIRRRGLPPRHGKGDEDKTSVEIFRAFAGTAETVPLATAVRLNATFPYVSPAIPLPTSPERRVVDAGYYDNYGVDLLTAYLEEEGIFGWITRNCAGVAVIQVRAFPSGALTPSAGGFGRAYQFLTSPVEAVLSARQASQMFRNDQQLALARTRYDSAAGRDFLRVFTFEANSDVSMSWYLRCDEMRALEALLHPPAAEDLTWDPEEIRARAAAALSTGGTEAPIKKVEEWALGAYEDDWEKLVAALQRKDPKALWAQFLHHRAKIAAEFDALADFWRDPAAPDPRWVQRPDEMS